MTACVFHAMLLVLLSEATKVIAQTTLTSSPNATIICEDEVVVYRCMEQNSSVSIFWNVEGFFVNTGFRNLDVEVGRAIPSDDNRLTIVQVSVDPLTATLDIPGRINEILTVNCSGSNLAQLRYISGVLDRDVFPPTDLQASSLDSCDSTSGISFQFQTSRSPDVVQYIVECSDGGCDRVEITVNAETTLVEGITRATIGNHNLMVYGVDRCGAVSDNVNFDPVTVDNTEECNRRFVAAVATGVVGLLLLLLSALLTIVLCLPFCKRKCCPSSEIRDATNLTRDDHELK